GALRIRESLELDTQRLAYVAAAALRAHDEAAPDALFLTRFIGHDRLDTIVVLGEGVEGGRHPDRALLTQAQELHRLLDDLAALALQDVREARVVLERGVVELGEHFVADPVPVLELRGDEPARLHLFVETEIVEHLERGRMDAARSRLLVEKALRGQRLNHAAPQPAPRQIERKAQADRARPHDQNGECFARHGQMRSRSNGHVDSEVGRSNASLSRSYTLPHSSASVRGLDVLDRPPPAARGES